MVSFSHRKCKINTSIVHGKDVLNKATSMWTDELKSNYNKEKKTFKTILKLLKQL